MKPAPVSIMLFAAGFGTRMGVLTKDRPKPLIKVAGKFLIDHAIDLAMSAKPQRIVANTHYLAEMLEPHLAARGVLVSPEQPDILDTGGGLKAALPMLDSDPVYTMNTDAIWSGDNPLDLLLAGWDPERMDALLMCVPISNAVGYSGRGDFTKDGEGHISRGPGLVYGGVQIIKTESLGDIRETCFSLNVLWDRIQSRQRLFALSYSGYWCDVGHPKGIELAESMLAKNDV
jgi:MurNAc alpha-1-phosphate uridylyltransferase